MIESYMQQPESFEPKHRCLAVIARDQGRVNEVVAGFAEVGDQVDTAWFATPEALLAAGCFNEFEAVIYYAATNDREAASREAELRAALGGTAFFRLAA